MCTFLFLFFGIGDGGGDGQVLGEVLVLQGWQSSGSDGHSAGDRDGGECTILRSIASVSVYEPAAWWELEPDGRTFNSPSSA